MGEAERHLHDYLSVTSLHNTYAATTSSGRGRKPALRHSLEKQLQRQRFELKQWLCDMDADDEFALPKEKLSRDQCVILSMCRWETAARIASIGCTLRKLARMYTFGLDHYKTRWIATEDESGQNTLLETNPNMVSITH